VRLGAFAGKQDLGYHGEMTSRGVGWMIRDRQITGKYKTLFPGKAIFSALNGLSSEEVDWASENPKVEIYDTTYVTDPRTIAANDNMVAINNGLTIDLTGQINSESIFGAIPINGPGGQPESHLGAIVSKGGRAVTVMRSTALKGTVSCIVPQMDAGALVIIPRCYADIVITEFGIARLMGKSLRERADELIAIAHPNFRAELRKEAKKLLWP
jgi:4-hydroxybutyrate CoA-transferase